MSQLAFNIGDQLFLGPSTPISSKPQYTSGGLFPFIWVIVKNIYVLIGIILFFIILIAGISILLNPGNPEKQRQSSSTITSAIVGLGFMLGAYWLVKLVEIIFGVTIFL